MSDDKDTCLEVVETGLKKIKKTLGEGVQALAKDAEVLGTDVIEAFFQTDNLLEQVRDMGRTVTRKTRAEIAGKVETPTNPGVRVDGPKMRIATAARKLTEKFDNVPGVRKVRTLRGKIRVYCDLSKDGRAIKKEWDGKVYYGYPVVAACLRPPRKKAS